MKVKRATVVRIVVSALVVCAVAVLGWIITIQTADYQRKQYFEVRKFQAASASACLDYHDIEELKGDPSDIGSPAFEKLRSQLVRVKESDSRIRFVYLMRPRNGKMIFLIDAEEPTSPDYSPPGQVYYEAGPSDFTVFKGKKEPDPEVARDVDRWGSWISATAYITDGSGKAIAMLGTDVDAENALASFNNIRRLGLTSDFIVALLLMAVAAQWIVSRYGMESREALRNEMEKSAVMLNEKLLEANRMKSEFIQVASHELRGPVTAVNVAINVAEERLRGKLDKTEQQIMDIACHGSKRLVDLVENLLDMSLIEAKGLVIKPEMVNIGNLVSETAEIFEPLAVDRGLNLLVMIPMGEHTGLADPGAVRRVLENLIANAIKFTDTGEIAVGLEAGESAILVTVSDSGRGIPREFHGRIFNKFVKAGGLGEDRQEGAGLGLAISKGLVESIGGRIWFESEEGQGSTFYLEIPRQRKPGGDQSREA